MTQESFWDFSIRIYAKPGVAQACLRLQDKHSLDVNLVLLCAWHGYYHGKFEPQAMLAMFNFASNWSDNIVKPLRVVRTWMKGRESLFNSPGKAYEMLRTTIKASELSAEKLQQQQLEQLMALYEIREVAGDEAAMVSNLESYLEFMEIEPTTMLRENFNLIVAAIN
jgi:uncharacterized protein (TIGR02444 family)